MVKRFFVKKLTVHLPEPLIADIEAEARECAASKSDIVRRRLEAAPRRRKSSSLDAIADLIGSVKGLPTDLSARKKHYLRTTRYGKKRHR